MAAQCESELVLLPALMRCLVDCSETGASIAKVFRLDKDLYELMAQEKKGDEKNLRFVHDVKTFADVLVQEAVKFNIGKKFPHLYQNVFGEESNEFTDTRGNTVKVNISGNVKETTNSIWKIFDENTDAANLLAVCIHMTQEVPFLTTLRDQDFTLASNRIGIWIDPIDATAEYINSPEDRTPSPDYTCRRGMRCVTVLIGAFDIETGLPIMGLVNQPFYRWDLLDEQYKSECFWGFHYNSQSYTSFNKAHIPCLGKRIFISGSEDAKLISIMKSKYTVVEMSGCGYKLLGVARGYADLYVLSHPFTYQWDTCGPHALLLSIGGGIISFKEAIKSESLLPEDVLHMQLKYTMREGHSATNSPYCNSLGIIAYRSHDILVEFLNHVKSLWNESN